MAITVVEAGRRGGLTLFQRHGREFFAEIGRKGQSVMRQKYPGMASEWGRLGGRPRKLKLEEVAGEKQQTHRKEARTRLDSAVLPRRTYTNP